MSAHFSPLLVNSDLDGPVLIPGTAVSVHWWKHDALLPAAPA
ncbi:MAG TPA: hypothetical protein VGR20_03500 [Acidimicrobiia bacterium]|nr:hypothetical protein [Acidimicrobiia bacterium]